MTPLQVLEAAFPEPECDDRRAELMMRNARQNYRIRIASGDTHHRDMYSGMGGVIS